MFVNSFIGFNNKRWGTILSIKLFSIDGQRLFPQDYMEPINCGIYRTFKWHPIDMGQEL